MDLAIANLKVDLENRLHRIKAIQDLIRGLQECLDWFIYSVFGLADERFSEPRDPIEPGARASDVLFAREVVAGGTGRRYFELFRLPSPEVIADPVWSEKWNLETAEGWEKERLLPLLAGVHELIPWLKQWHNEPSPEYGNERLGDYFASFVDGEARALGITTADLAAWRPQAKGRGRGPGRKAAPVSVSDGHNETAAPEPA